MNTRLLVIGMVLHSLSLLAMDSEIALISNRSRYPIFHITIKLKRGKEKGKITIPSLEAGQATRVNLNDGFKEVGEQPINILKVRPKTCMVEGKEKKCRGRMKPENPLQRSFTIVDEKPGVFKMGYGAHGLEKGKAMEEMEERLVRVE